MFWKVRRKKLRTVSLPEIEVRGDMISELPKHKRAVILKDIKQ
jgi:hypothetical protein